MTPWFRVVLDKLIVIKHFKKLTNICEARRFTTVCEPKTDNKLLIILNLLSLYEFSLFMILYLLEYKWSLSFRILD